LGQRQANIMTKLDKITWAARIINIAALVSFALVYTIVYPNGLIIIAVFALAIIIITWILPVVGGILMLAVGIPVFYNIFVSNYDFIVKLSAYILSLILIASGITHILITWRGKRLRDKQEKNKHQYS